MTPPRRPGPRPRLGSDAKRFTLYLPTALREGLERASDRHGLDMADIIRRGIGRELAALEAAEREERG